MRSKHAASSFGERNELSSLVDRGEFHVLQELTYLNTASIGLVPAVVQAEAHRVEGEIAMRGTTWFDETIETDVLERTRVAAAKLLNAPGDRIAVTSSATEALSQVAWGLKPPAGTNVVTADIEFPSVTYPWFRVAMDTGAEVRVARDLDNPASFSLDSIARLVDDRTHVIAISHVQYGTGHRLSLEELSELAALHGSHLVVDATQSMGHVPLDLGSAGVDITALVAGGYKWLCGPFGAAVCYLDEELVGSLDPVFVGWRSAPNPYDMDAGRLVLAKDARKLEFSTMSYSAAVGLGAAIEYMADVGAGEVLRHDQALADRLACGLEELGATVLTPRDEGSRGGIVTVRFPGADGGDIAGWLNSSGVIVSPRAGSLRFSVHVFNDSADIDRALDVLAAVLKRGGPIKNGGRPRPEHGARP